jgi:hypothetical protein
MFDRTKVTRVSLALLAAGAFVGAGGTGYAAKLISGKDIRDGSVTGRDIKDGSISSQEVSGLTAADFAPGALPPGAPGSPGAAGAKGEQGPKGDSGASGSKGDAGIQGPKGDTGSAGTLFVPFSSAPDGQRATLGTFGSETIKAECSSAGGTTTLTIYFNGPDITIDGSALRYSGTRTPAAPLSSAPGSIYTGVTLISNGSDTQWDTLSATQGNQSSLSANEVVRATGSRYLVSVTATADGGAAGTGIGAGCRLIGTATELATS